MKNSVRRGLFHPDDIKTVGLTSTGLGPLSAPLPSLSRRSSRPSLSPIHTPPPSFGPASAAAHTRSVSQMGGSGSFGRAEARRLQNQAEFGKYTEEDDEDYEDVFGKPTSGRYLESSLSESALSLDSSFRNLHADPAIEYSVIQQILGMFLSTIICSSVTYFYCRCEKIQMMKTRSQRCVLTFSTRELSQLIIIRLTKGSLTTTWKQTFNEIKMHDFAT